MDFTIKNIDKNVVSVARELGYVIIDTKESREYNMVRKLGYGGNYPRFHVYLKQQVGDFVFSLHLDQKAPIYKGVGVHAHNGEYFGPVIDEEIGRIKDILANKSL